MTRMKKIVLLATAIVALASCVDDTYVGDQDLSKANEPGAITFGFDVPNVTRAGGASAATALGNRFIVYGEKGAETNAAPTSGNLVFPNYQVNYVANTAYNTTSNTKNWEYVGYTHTTNYQNNITRKATGEATPVKASDAAQTIKYWDYGAANYIFTAVSALDADIENGRVKIQKNEYGTSKYDKGYTITLAKSGTEGSYTYPKLDKLYFSDRLVIAQGQNTDRTATNQYGGNATLSFRNLVSQVRAGIYETIPGYDIKEIKFYVSDGADADTDLDITTDHAFGAICPNIKVNAYEGTLTVVYYSDTDGSIKNQPKVTATGTSASDLILGKNFNTLNSTTPTLLGQAANSPTWDTSGGTFTEVMPQINNSTSLKLTVDFTLWNSVTHETIEVTGATAEVPAAYLQWKPNYKYTYLFKITYDTNGSTGQGIAGLYPVTFDALEVEASNGEVEYITTVSEPSITSYAKASAVITDNEYRVNSNIYVAVEDNSTNPSLTVNTNAKLYTVTLDAGAAQEISEKSVANAIQSGTYDSGAKTWTVTDALSKSMVVTDISDKLTGALTAIPAADSPSGVDLSINCAKFTPTAAGDYVFEYSTNTAHYTEKEAQAYNASLPGAISTTDVAYSFTSYKDASGTTQYGTGKVKQMSQDGGWTTVLVTANDIASFVGQQFKVNATEIEADKYYQLHSTEGTALPIYVKVESSSFDPTEVYNYNATLEGHKTTGDVKTVKTYKVIKVVAAP